MLQQQVCHAADGGQCLSVTQPSDMHCQHTALVSIVVKAWLAPGVGDPSVDAS